MNWGGAAEATALEQVERTHVPDDVINIQFTSGTTGQPKVRRRAHWVSNWQVKMVEAARLREFVGSDVGLQPTYGPCIDQVHIWKVNLRSDGGGPCTKLFQARCMVYMDDLHQIQRLNFVDGSQGVLMQGDTFAESNGSPLTFGPNLQASSAGS
jgi:hypothetical protein